MTPSKMLAGLIGPTFVVTALGMFLNLNALPAMIEQAGHEPALILLSGIATFVVGLAIVRVHNLWEGGWPIIVTILGWLFVLGGLARIVFPTQLAAAAIEVAGKAFIAGEAAVLLVLGAFLSFEAYVRE